MDKSEKYDIKEASNPGLTASARRNYADNAESNAKGVKQTAKQRRNLNPIIVKAIAAKKGAPKQIKPKRPGVKKIKAPKTGKAPGADIKNKKTKITPPPRRRPTGINKVEDEKREKERRRKNRIASSTPSGKENKDGRKGRKDPGSPKMKGPYMESNAQEKTNLMSDNPIASRASGGSWMSKFSKSRM